jgi:SnoaL-like domain
MTDLQAIADRVEIDALRAEYTDAVMMRDYDRVGRLFTRKGTLRMPNIPVELTGLDEIRAFGDRVPTIISYFIQNTHPGPIQLDGDTASGRAYMFELIGLRDGQSELNYAVYHDRYERTPDGWRFTDRLYEVRYHDSTPHTGTAAQTSTLPS